MRHPSEATIRDWAVRRSMPGPRQEQHIARCDACRSALDLWRALARVTAVVTGQGRPLEAHCPEDAVLVQLADTGAGPDRVAAHIAACGSCASKVERLSAMSSAGPLPVASSLDDAPSLLDRLRALVTVEMPLAVVITPRGAAAPVAAGEYGSALAAYRQQRWDDAERLLAAVQKSGERAPGLALYLGACQLRRGEHAAAATTFTLAIRARPGSAEPHWYHAQALLGDGRGPEALAALRRAARRRGPHASRARSLERQVEPILRTFAAQQSDKPKDEEQSHE